MKTQNDLEWKMGLLHNFNKHLFNIYTMLGSEQVLQI